MFDLSIEHFRKVVINCIFLFTLIGVSCLAWAYRFIQDDAFISFRYAFNLVHGHGLTWNPGERIQGYTNLLWTLLMAIPLTMNYDPTVFSQIIGIFFTVGTLWATYKVACIIFRSHFLAVFTILMLGTNYTFIAYATGGLETQMQTFFIVTGIFLGLSILVHDDAKYRVYCALLSFVFSLAILTRLDSMIAFLVLFPFLFWQIFARPYSSLNRKMVESALLVLPATVILGSWLIWNYSYYGDILPNTYYAKATLYSINIFKQGVLYIREFLLSYLLMPFVFIAMFNLKDFFLKSKLCIITAIIILWNIYLIRVGGDFMEFRFLVPVLPFIFIIITFLLSTIINKKVRIALFIMILFGSFSHAYYYKGTITEHLRIESIYSLNSNLVYWSKAGLVLKELFYKSDSDVVIATTAAGAIPYYSQLKTIDMHGLNDRWIARNGIVFSPRVAHRRLSSHKYLVERGVNLVIGHPKIELLTETYPKEIIGDLDFIYGIFKIFRIIDPQKNLISGDTEIIVIPIDNLYGIHVLYVKKNNHIDDVIKKNNYKTYKLFQS